MQKQKTEDNPKTEQRRNLRVKCGREAVEKVATESRGAEVAAEEVRWSHTETEVGGGREADAAAGSEGVPEGHSRGVIPRVNPEA